MSIWRERQSINVDGEEFFLVPGNTGQKRESEHALVVELGLLEGEMGQHNVFYQKSPGRETKITLQRVGINTRALVQNLSLRREGKITTVFSEAFAIEMSPLGCCGIMGLSFGSVGETTNSCSHIGLHTPVYQERLQGSKYLDGLKRAGVILRKIRLDMLGQTAPKT
ncbi:hypothetical protein HY345_03855 [Candidatus Microgenomates bacterium]|nr:hypothetical protein [Candidatus Microgenomates bacterium]